MNPFNAPDLPTPVEELAEAILARIRTLLLHVRKHCLKCRLNGWLPSLYTREAISAFLSGLVELAADTLPRYALHAIECEALGVMHEARFLMRGTRDAYANALTPRREA